MSRRRGGRDRRLTESPYAQFFNNPSRNRQDVLESLYRRILTELSCNRFKWHGLPDSVDKRFLELTLFNQSLAIFYYDKEFSRYFALRGTGAGVINMYDNFTEFRVLGNHMINKELTAKECVPIWANYLRRPDLDIVEIYAWKFAQLDRTIEINLDAMRHTNLLFVPENMRLSYQNIMRQKTEGQPTIFGTDALDPTLIQSFPVAIDKDTVLNLQVSKAKLWNECMTLLGINNANQDKKERLISGEVEANNGQVKASRDIALNARQEACDQINKLYPDLKVSVEWNSDIEAEAETALGGVL